MAPILGIWASQISGRLWEPAGAYDALATVTVPSGGVASVTFAGIPTGYKHLQIRAITGGTSTPTQIDLTLNGDTAANYAWHQVAGNGSTAFADNSINRNNIVGFAAVGASFTNIFAGSIMDILDYSSIVKFKTTRTLTGYDLNGSGVVSLDSGLWRSTSAITSITFTPRSNLISQYSTFSLFGVK